MIFNRKLRLLMDWIELPRTLYVLKNLSDIDREKTLDHFNNWRDEWRKNTPPFRVSKWYLNMLERHSSTQKH